MKKKILLLVFAFFLVANLFAQSKVYLFSYFLENGKDGLHLAYSYEGPSPLIVGEYIYVYFDKYRNHEYGAIRTKDRTTWEDVSSLVSFPKGIRHGTAFTADRKVLGVLLNHKD
jgi:hypothetical protein